MPDEYLWDGKGQPDPEVARLEAMLTPLSFGKPRRRNYARKYGIAATAVVVVALGYTLLRPRQATVWSVAGHASPVYAGQVIESGNSKVQLEAASIGSVEMEPGSRMRVTASKPDRQVLDLQYGTMHALIWAPPSRFAVETPSARSIDLGCSYTLTTERDGRGLLTVETGWVAFQSGRIESFIPAGAMCRTRPRLGPGTPYFSDAAADFRVALDRFDETGDRNALKRAIAEATERDGLSLWHLLTRAPDERGVVFDRLTGLIKLPASVTREGVLRADARMLDQAWDALDLGETGWWRSWKRDWPAK
jgi:hypothetical protein